MKKLYYISFIIIVIASLTSCKDRPTKMGEVAYHPKFLWCKAQMDTLVRTYRFDFSDDAKADPARFAEFEFVDNAGEPIPQEEMVVYVDGVKTHNNRFRVNSNEESKEVGITFTDHSKRGKHQGYLRLVKHNLDRIDNTQLQPGQSADVFQWTVQFKKKLNSLAVALIWVGIVILAALLLWFIVLRPAIYPHFGKMRKIIIVRQNGKAIYQKSIEFKGVRTVLLTDKPVKQSVFKRLFVGKTVVVINSLFENCIRFTPNKKGALAISRNYTVEPNPIPRRGDPYVNINM